MANSDRKRTSCARHSSSTGAAQPLWHQVNPDVHWKQIGRHPHHGICLPLSALRTKNGSGIGEFLDLIPLIDWCKTLNLDCIQLLPINDSGSDPSPYNPLSSCALNPIYLKTEPDPILNKKQRLSYEEVLKKKLTWLRHSYETTYSALSKTKEYLEFTEQNPWLEKYALFKALKEQFEEANWTDWPAHYNPPSRKEIDFYIFLQFHCFDQMQKVRAHGSAQGVRLGGDLPILISPDSADVWTHKELFILDLEAGAPPDYYNPLGQNWGFPLVNLEVLRKTHYDWLKQRLAVSEKLYHFYRIDHVVGFFRIWGIPKGENPDQGSFYPSDQAVWASQGKELLEVFLKNSPLLPIAEDLGTIPKMVPMILKELGIPSTKVVRWQRRYETDQSFISYDEYEPISMTTLSTHDMETLQEWWKNFPDESKAFASFKHWDYHPILSQEQRLEVLKDAHSTSSLFHINLLQEYLALFPELVWPDSKDERINIPGTLLSTNWTYRVRPFLEDIIPHKGLTEAFSQITRGKH